ncbi:metallophosphoesterase family protein [Halovenus aranensis]|uniref:metallophosphoesterase family protein n=1 Tax=Halovenus aranensis TaxID=890420 RepID=UPI00373FDFF3
MSDVSFDDRVAANHLRLDAEAYENVYVVGDVHGCLPALQDLWDRLDPSPREMVVFVGDLIRKGPTSTGVVDFVASRPNAVSVRGNNEMKVIEGTVDTVRFEPVREAIESTPLVVSWEDSMAVHGGVDPRRALSAQAPIDLLETRAIPPENGYDGPFWFKQYDGPGRVFFGHTVLESPFLSEHAVGLDTGCVYGGELTAYDCNRDEVVSVTPERTYQERADEKILSF